MGLMPMMLSWSDIVVRLFLSVVAGTLVGLNRGESGKVAGLRTTLLVCLAACLAMLQVNALLAQTGKQTDSFVVLDLMRLPLGILSGVGFIGAGAILRKDGLVFGVTTAATLWFVTVLGLCIGGGQLLLGMAGLVLGLATLWGLKQIERRIPREVSALLTLEYERTSNCRSEFIEALRRVGCGISPKSMCLKTSTNLCEESFQVRWRGTVGADNIPPLAQCAVDAGANSVRWSTE
jgi:putative Mg2+ transporter-C (MgtC) family protein